MEYRGNTVYRHINPKNNFSQNRNHFTENVALKRVGQEISEEFYPCFIASISAQS
nr:hypothetical protein [Mucilaginibacter sp. X5P1]